MRGREHCNRPDMRLRLLLGPLAQAGAILLMGPVLLALGGAGEVTLPAALASFRLTGPLAAVVFGGQLLLRWSDPQRET
jgi:hypothetical protein